MIGSEMQAIREKLGMERKDFGLLLGYTGDLAQIYKTIQRYESGRRRISPMIARLTYLVGLYFDGGGRVVEWPDSIDVVAELEPEECD